MTVFKIIASKGGRVVFDERVEANTPREARRKMKERLGIETLSGIVYAITEIPLHLIKQIVAEEIAAATLRRDGGNEIDVAALVQSASRPVIRVERYRQTRFWAVWRGPELVAVVVYKKGAMAVAELARKLEEHNEPRLVQAA